MDKFKEELDFSRFTMLSNFGPDGKEAQILNSNMHLVEMINDVVIWYVEQIRELEIVHKTNFEYIDEEIDDPPYIAGYEYGYEAGYDNGYSDGLKGIE